MFSSCGKNELKKSFWHGVSVIISSSTRVLQQHAICHLSLAFSFGSLEGFWIIVFGSSTTSKGLGICYILRDREDLVLQHSRAHWAFWNPVNPRQISSETYKSKGEHRLSSFPQSLLLGLCESGIHIVKSALILLSIMAMSGCAFFPHIWCETKGGLVHLVRLFILKIWNHSTNVIKIPNVIQFVIFLKKYIDSALSLCVYSNMKNWEIFNSQREKTASY